MHVDRQTEKNVSLTLTHDEIVMLNNALNEVCNGVDFADDEFLTRLGFSRKRVRELLHAIGTLPGKK